MLPDQPQPLLTGLDVAGDADIDVARVQVRPWRGDDVGSSAEALPQHLVGLVVAEPGVRGDEGQQQVHLDVGTWRDAVEGSFQLEDGGLVPALAAVDLGVGHRQDAPRLRGEDGDVGGVPAQSLDVTPPGRCR